jgi:hypothetical protein
MPARIAFGTTLPISAPDKRMTISTTPTRAPAQRELPPDSSKRRLESIDNELPKPPPTEASKLAMPFERYS